MPSKSKRISAPASPTFQNPGDPHLLTKEQLAARLSTTPRQIELMVYRRKIPVIRLGHRTIRFNWQKVEAALAKLEVKAI